MTSHSSDTSAPYDREDVLVRHGARDLPRVRVDAYNAELHDPSGEGFLGDRASNRAFTEILEDWRIRVRRGAGGEDPLEEALGEERATDEIDRSELDILLHAAAEDPEAAGLVHSAMSMAEEYWSAWRSKIGAAGV